MFHVRINQSRDLRVDFAKGMCLCFIFVDHVHGNALAHYTLQNFVANDAADVFVFLSGVSAALAYGRRFDREGWRAAGKSIFGRVLTIYGAYVALVAAVAAVVALGTGWGWPDVRRAFWFQDQDLTAGGLLRMALMIRRPPVLEILPLYVVVLSGLAVVLPLVRRPLILLTTSAALWGAAYVTHLDFAPVSWQFTFVLGFLGCRHARPLAQAPDRLLTGIAACLLLAGVVSRFVLPSADPWEAYDHLGWPLKLLLRGANKTEVDPGRILSLLSMAWLVFRFVRRDAPWLKTSWACVPIALGQHSLPVFAVGVLLSGSGSLVLLASPDGFAACALVNVAGLAGLVATAWASERGTGATTGRSSRRRGEEPRAVRR